MCTYRSAHSRCVYRHTHWFDLRLFIDLRSKWHGNKSHTQDVATSYFTECTCVCVGVSGLIVIPSCDCNSLSLFIPIWKCRSFLHASNNQRYDSIQTIINAIFSGFTFFDRARLHHICKIRTHKWLHAKIDDWSLDNNINGKWYRCNSKIVNVSFCTPFNQKCHQRILSCRLDRCKIKLNQTTHLPMTAQICDTLENVQCGTFYRTLFQPFNYQHTAKLNESLINTNFEFWMISDVRG